MDPYKETLNKIVQESQPVQEKVAAAAEKMIPSSNHNWFRMGEIITIDGVKFRVAAVKPGEIRLKLLPRSAQS
jgi:hypothetical protein